MKKIFRDMKKIFAFTLRNQFRSKKYRGATIAIPILLFFLPVLVLMGMNVSGQNSKAQENSGKVNAVSKVYVADETGLGISGFDTLNSLGVETYDKISWKECENLEHARTEAKGKKDTVILFLDQEEEKIQMHLLIPEESLLEKEDCEGLENFLAAAFPTVLAQSAGVDPDQAAGIQASVQSQVSVQGEQETVSADAMVREVFSEALPYIFIMVLYFLVLIYGQGVANSIVMEKSSKLMDTFLTSVKPVSIIFGKVTAIVCASIIQFALWVIGLLLGFISAVHLTGTGGTGTDVLAFIKSAGFLQEMFSVPGVIIAVLILISGFVLYCAIASIGGSAAGKSEDLSSTNVLFTLILVVSFFISLAAGGISMGGGSDAAVWIYWIPFTSVLTLPGRLILGEVPLEIGIGALAVSVVTAVIFLYLAAKIYRMMALYRGNPPTPAKLFRMLRGK